MNLCRIFRILDNEKYFLVPLFQELDLLNQINRKENYQNFMIYMCLGIYLNLIYKQLYLYGL